MRLINVDNLPIRYDGNKTYILTSDIYSAPVYELPDKPTIDHKGAFTVETLIKVLSKLPPDYTIQYNHNDLDVDNIYIHSESKILDIC